MSNKKIYEWCPYCTSEVTLIPVLMAQKCPECDKWIVPCSICEKDDCKGCEVEQQASEKNNGKAIYSQRQ